MKIFNNISKKEGKITTVIKIFLLKIILSAPWSHEKTAWRAGGLHVLSIPHHVVLLVGRD